jgi:hypothetical protein
MTPFGTGLTLAECPLNLGTPDVPEGQQISGVDPLRTFGAPKSSGLICLDLRVSPDIRHQQLAYL